MKSHIPFSFTPPDEDFPFSEDSLDPDSSRLMTRLHLCRFMEANSSGDSSFLPDPYGCECLFLEDFITYDMELDFAAIARDFLLHEYSTLSHLSPWLYGHDHPSDSDMEHCVRRKILNLMYLSAKNGSAFSISLFRNLYKTYYRKEYQQLKRFRKIHAQEVLALSEDSARYVSVYSMARILCICPFFGIEKDHDCSYLYVALDSRFDEICREEDEENKDLFLQIPSPLLTESQEIIEEWLKDLPEDFYNDRRLRTWKVANRFVSTSLLHNGYPSDYVYRCSTEIQGIRLDFAKTLALLRLKHPDRSYSLEEVQLYSVLYNTVTALTSASDSAEDSFHYIFLQQQPDSGTDASLCNPSHNVSVEKAEKNPVETPLVSKAPASSETAALQELTAEIDSLRKKSHQQAQELRHLRTLYTESKKISGQLEALRTLYEDQQKELTALRNHVYQMSEESSVTAALDPAAMETAISAKKIIIIGGHTNWSSKLKNKFPGWVFISPQVSGTLDERILEKADYIYFFTDFISHSTYQKYLRLIRDRNLAFGYIHSVHIPTNIRQIYGDLFG